MGRRTRTLLAVLAVVLVGAGLGTAYELGFSKKTPAAAPTTTAGPLAADELTLWDGPLTPGRAADDTTQQVELGTRFTSTAPGLVTGVRYWRLAGDTGQHTGALWTLGGTRLTTVTFPAGGTQTGWQLARLAAPVQLQARTQYVVSYHASGAYAADLDYFGPGRTVGQGPLTALGGYYAYGASTYPRLSYRNAAYYADVVFRPTGTSPATTPPSTTTPTTTTTTTRVAPTTTSAPTRTTPPAKPAASAWPTAATTGWKHTGVTLARIGCPGEINEPGTVIDGKDVPCGLLVTADDVTIRRSRVTTDSEYGIRAADGVRGLRIEDVEVVGGGPDCEAGVAFANWTGVRLDVHGCADGARTEGNVTLQDSYVHDLARNDSTHNDAIQATGSSNVVIRHNRLENPRSQTSCILIGGEGGPPSNWLVEDNFFDGGNYSIYLDPNGSNRVIRNNTFARTFVYGPLNLAGQYVLTGNRYADGKPVDD